LIATEIQNGQPATTGYPLTLVIPCFNESAGLDQLEDRLESLLSVPARHPIREVIFVDDGSQDETLAGLERRFRDKSWARIVHHEENRGIAGAIKTGIQHAQCDWVATMDADCTYDPSQLEMLAERLSDDVSVVTASPYHPAGKVIGVPAWRLWLSRLASTAYRFLFHNHLYTYTSCFRIYRKSSLSSLPITQDGFVGIAEILWQIDRRGGRIIEVPATLSTRRVGYSKMRTLPVILQHMRFMTQAFFRNLYPARSDK
jgi:dolichol-phosphate mannosyltransferase